jgi:metallo-beta-lactamase family protein
MRGSQNVGKSRPSVPTLSFLGAAKTVTGSRFLVETQHARVLVDCGLFQGLKELRLRNWNPLPVKPADVDAIVLTHAHIDHCGYVPVLTRGGFTGPVFATKATCRLCDIVLPDSGHLQEEDAEYANRVGFSKHSPALPLYTEADARRALEHLRPVPFGSPVEVAAGIRATLHRAGHILGSAMITLDIEHSGKRTVLFTGDLGRPAHPILRSPVRPPAADILVTESTYGDREHEDVESLRRFDDAVTRTAARRGVMVIPSFAVDRTEVVLFHLRRLMRNGQVPEIPVYVDSPMALAALNVYREAIAARSSEIEAELLEESDPFDPGQLIEVRSIEESKAIDRRGGPAIIVSASGMATGGRVLHHLAQHLGNPRNAVMLVGFQAEGTRGRRLLEGANEIKMHGRYIPVSAEVVHVPAFSVHADRSEILAWLKDFPRPPEQTLVVHGEAAAADALNAAIESELGWNSTVPGYLEQVRLA